MNKYVQVFDRVSEVYTRLRDFKIVNQNVNFCRQGREMLNHVEY
jgi:hypothetical protein